MNRSLWRKAVALTLTAAMTAGLTACGGGGNSTSAEEIFQSRLSE